MAEEKYEDFLDHEGDESHEWGTEEEENTGRKRKMCHTKSTKGTEKNS